MPAIKHTIVVLNDGETFSDLVGCRVMEIIIPQDCEDETGFIESALRGDEDAGENIVSVKEVVAGKDVGWQF